MQVLAGGWPKELRSRHLLHDAVSSDPDPGVAVAALGSLAIAWRDHRGTLPLRRRLALGDGDDALRRAAAACLLEGWPQDDEIQAAVDELDREAGEYY